jgi:hypothetical protein
MLWINKGYVSGGKALQIKTLRPGGEERRELVIKLPIKGS